MVQFPICGASITKSPAPDSQQTNLCCGFAPSRLPWDCEAPTYGGEPTMKKCIFIHQ